jgi:hypothetical protein
MGNRGPSPRTPRLADLAPATVAAEVVTAVREHIGRLSFCLQPAHTWHEQTTAGSFSTLALTVEDLTRFAQTGDTADWGGPEGARDAMQEVCAALYSRAGEPGTFGVGELEDVIEDSDPTSVGLVLRAAWARLMIAEGGPVSSAQVAALAGLNPRAVRQLVEAGELSARKRDGEITVKADEARRWLGARGVAGFSTPRNA